MKRGTAAKGLSWLGGLCAGMLLLNGCGSNGGGGVAPPQGSGLGQQLSEMRGADRDFVVTSRTFKDDTRVPQSMVYHGVAGSTCNGGDKSPQLSWFHAPAQTRSFTVLMFDVTASFTHWGMYNIPGTRTDLPEDAGVAGSRFGQQIYNDFLNPHYDGPCPPPGLVHHYLITVFALDCSLDLPSAPGFPPVAETLLYALLEGRARILGTASITGLYST